MLPGSTRFYDREAGVVRACDALGCPLATQEAVASYTIVSGAASGRDPGQGGPGKGPAPPLEQLSWSAAGVQISQSQVAVNRAPYSVHIKSQEGLCNPKRDAQGNEISGVCQMVGS